MSTTTKTEEPMYPPPSKKAKGDTNDTTTTLASTTTANNNKTSAAPPNGAASSADAVADFLAFLENPKVKAALGKYFASREDLEELKGELKGEHDQLKAEHDQLKAEHDQLKARFEQITTVFEPATQFALFESAIYEFVHSEIQNLFSMEEKQEKAKHAMAVLCDDIVKRLVVDSTTKKQFAIVGFSFRGGRSKKETTENMTREQWKPSVLRALHGLAAYIEIEQESTVKKWATNSEQRNLVVHDGAFVNALYGTPDGKPNNGKASFFTETKEKVKTSRQILKEKSREDFSLTTLDDALDEIVKALGLKVLEVEEEVKASVVDELKRLVGDTVAKREG